MKVVIVSPPLTSPFSPPLGIVALASYLRHNGIEAHPIDASIEALHYLLAPDRIRANLAASSDAWRSGVLSGAAREAIARRRMTPSAANGPRLSQENIAQILKAAWQPRAIRLRHTEFESDLALLNDALLFAYAHCFPTVLSLADLQAEGSILSDPRQNPFREYYRERLIPTIEELDPDLIGISYGFTQQLLPGMSLQAELRQRVPAPVVVGGSFFTLLCDELVRDLGDTIDRAQVPDRMRLRFDVLREMLGPYGIRGEGEAPLLRLSTQVASGKSVTGIPGLVRHGPDAGSIAFNAIPEPVPGHELPVLSLDGLPIGRKYFTPLRVAPLLSSRGCYWNRCTFCDHGSPIDRRFRQLPLETVVGTLHAYADAGIECAMFCDEAMPPGMLRGLSERLLGLPRRPRFATMARIEEKLVGVLDLAAQAGLTFLSFGLESGCSRIVSLMNKGYARETALELLACCDANRVLVQYFVMFGFPTETTAEACETMRYLEENATKIVSVRATQWQLAPGSAISKDMRRFGVHPDPRSADPDAWLVEGMTREEAGGFLARLGQHELFRGKMISCLRNEEYHIIKALVQQG